MSFDQCRTCQAPLVDGVPVNREGAAGRTQVRLENVPTRRCPKGCPGLYWYWLDFGVELFDALHQKHDWMAARKGFFLNKQGCPRCKTELREGAPKTFVFPVDLHKGQQVRMSVTTPAQHCAACGQDYFPANTGRGSRFNVELGDAMSAAATQELIHD